MPRRGPSLNITTIQFFLPIIPWHVQDNVPVQKWLKIGAHSKHMPDVLDRTSLIHGPTFKLTEPERSTASTLRHHGTYPEVLCSF